MYNVNTPSDKTLKIRFHHHKAGKGQPPKSTTCRITEVYGSPEGPGPNGESLVGEGVSRRCAQTSIVVDAGDIDVAVLAHGKKVKKVYRTDDKSQGVIILTADNFSYDRARKVALKKALAHAKLEKADRRAAYAAVLGDIVKAPAEEEAVVAVS